jgi:vacuolar-type H+-ATPase subunit E/Vma4
VNQRSQEVLHQYRHLLDGVRERLKELLKMLPANESELTEDPDYFEGGLMAQMADLGAIVTKQQEFWER